jgi:acyl-coenzyme A thioesterase PaaI-like protein
MVRHLKGSRLRRLINFWPPFLFAGIRSTRIDPDFRAIDVALVLRWFNRNYVGTHFGGSLFAMTDPWYMLMLMQNLGRDYYVWDQRSTIEFIAPGRGTVRAEFRIDEALLETIRQQTAAGAKYLPDFTIDIRDANQELVARVHKTIYIRKKPQQRQPV